MLLAIGLPRETVFIANILKCRPPGNRDPKPEEVSRCLPFLSAQIGLLKPKIILVVGRIAAQNLLATDAPLARLRGKLHHYGEAQDAAGDHLSPGLSVAHAVRQAQGLGRPQVRARHTTRGVAGA